MLTFPDFQGSFHYNFVFFNYNWDGIVWKMEASIL